MDFMPMKDLMDRLTQWRIPGNAIMIYKDNKPVFEYCSGFSNISNNEKMTMDRYFYMYSCTKIVTTLAALQLYEKGYYLLDDPLYDFIPAFKDMYYRSGNEIKKSRPITIRHLFTMTAGFNYDFNSPAFKKAEKITNGHFETVPTIECLAQEPLDFEPGERFQYSLCHDVLAAFTEVVSGKKFRTYVKENIFDPLNINASFVNGSEEQKRLCSKYLFIENSTDGKPFDFEDPKHNIKNSGKIVEDKLYNHHILGDCYDSAGMITSVPDFAKLTAAISDNGKTPGGERLISPGTIALWKTNQLSETQRSGFNWPRLKGYGYGLGIQTLMNHAEAGCTPYCDEFGWGGAAGAYALMDTKNNVSLFYAHHLVKSHSAYVWPRLRNVLYKCLDM